MGETTIYFPANFSKKPKIPAFPALLVTLCIYSFRKGQKIETGILARYKRGSLGIHTIFLTSPPLKEK